MPSIKIFWSNLSYEQWQGRVLCKGFIQAVYPAAALYGIKVCDCKSKDTYNYHCHRRFSDLEARHGWNSYHEQWFYGYYGYFLSVFSLILLIVRKYFNILYAFAYYKK
jgi:hypothetical protein